MKTIALAGALATAACAMGIAPAGATTIDIGLNTVAGLSGITTEATGTGAAGASFMGAYNGFTFNVVAAADTVPINLGSTSLNAVAGLTPPGPIYVYVTETGLTSANSALNFLSGLTENNLPTGWSVTETTFEDNSNVAYGMANTLATSSGPPNFAENIVASAVPVSSTFSLTELFVINSNGFAGSDQSTELITTVASVPEPPTWAMLGLGFAGLGLLGVIKPRRKDPRYAL